MYTGQYYLRARYYNPVVYFDPSGRGTTENGCGAGGVKKPKDTQAGEVGRERRIRDIYRAVSPEEYDDIFAIGGFRGRPDGMSFKANEFGNNFDETLEFANQSINLDKAAIVKVTIPENVYDQLEHMNLDRAIFKSGTPVIEPDMLDLFYESIISIEHGF